METRAPGDMTIAILSDIHFAGPGECARSEDYELRIIANPLVRAVARAYRHLIWMRHPLEQGRQLDRFLAEIGPVDYLVANGDYSCDSAFVGVSDPAAFQSAQECLGKLRAKFGDRARFTFGDHELGKLTLFGGKGGMRLASWHCATRQLGLQPFWKFSVGNYLLIGVASPLIALPACQPDVLPEEWPEWERLREAHLAEIRAAFDDLQPEQRVLLFLPRPDSAAISVARRIGAPPVAPGGTNNSRPSAHAPHFVEKPDVVGNSAHPVFRPERQPVHLGAARGASLVAVPRAALSGIVWHPTVERRRLLHRAD